MADTIYNSKNNTLISGTSGNDTIYSFGSNSTIDAGKGNDYVYNLGDEFEDGFYVTIDGGEGNDRIQNEIGSFVEIFGGTGNDTILNFGGKSVDDMEFIQTEYVTIDGGEGNDYISNYLGKYSSVSGGAGDDYIYTRGEHTTVAGGSGNDSINNDGRTTLFIYANGDDTVKDFTSGCTLKIGDGKSDTYSKEIVGSDILLTVGDGSILLVGAADYSAVGKILGKEIVLEENSWTLDGTTATYGSLIVKGVKSLDGLKLSGKTVTVSASSLGTEKITVSDGYTLKLADDVNAPVTEKSWRLNNSTAAYKKITTAGYTLADNEISYTKKSSKTLATVKGVKSLDGLKLSGKIVTVSASSLGTEKITVSDGYTLKLADDVNAPVTEKSWRLNNSTAAYKKITTAGYTLADNKISYTKKSTKTLATVKGVKNLDGLKVSGSTVKLAASALSKKVTVSGAYNFDFANDYSKATITDSSSSDTIIARGKKILLKGGAGSDTLKLFGMGTISGGGGEDIFIVKSTAANVISDYEDGDKISLTSGTADTSTSGEDFIINGKISVAGGADKIVTYIDADGEHVYKKSADAVKFNDDGSGATLTAKYSADEFTPNEYISHAETLVTIDASAVTNALEILGNKKANRITGSDEDDFIDGAAGGDKIFGADGNDTLAGGKGNDSLNGGAGDDSLWGGAGSDTLFGGDGSDVFVYKAGDGTVIVEDYTTLDKIRVLSGEVKTPDSDGKNVTFAVDEGQIIIMGGADKYIPIYYGKNNKNIVQRYTPH